MSSDDLAVGRWKCSACGFEAEGGGLLDPSWRHVDGRWDHTHGDQSGHHRGVRVDDRAEAERIAFNAWHSTRCVECAADPEWTNCSSLTNEFEAYREGLRAGRVALIFPTQGEMHDGWAGRVADVQWGIDKASFYEGVQWLRKRLAAAKGGGSE